MKQLNYHIDIDAAPQQVWETLWGAESYAEWSSGQRFEGNWEKGSTMKFFDADNNGMYNEVTENIPNSKLTMKHLGWIMAGEMSPQDWQSAITYNLKTEGNTTRLEADVNSHGEFVDFYEGYFPKVLKKIKEITENKTK